MVEQVTIQNEDKVESLEEAAQALDEQQKGQEDPKLAGEEETPERPEWLPEKFNTPEDMAKAYAELEKAQSKGEDITETKQETDEAAEKAVTDAGLDMEGLSAEYAEKGELTQESLEKLAKVGITEEMVNAYIKGQEAQANEIQADLLEPVGGDVEKYQEMTAWATDNLSDQEIDDFNSVLESGNAASIKLAVKNLSDKYTDANGEEPGRQLSGKPSVSGQSVYESTADLMKDMGNPEYHTNPSFRAKVEAKLARSSIL